MSVRLGMEYKICVGLILGVTVSGVNSESVDVRKG